MLQWLLALRASLRVRLHSTDAARFQPFLRVATVVVLCLAVRRASTKGDTLLGCLESRDVGGREEASGRQGTRV